jgi:hypothetical protein
MRDTLATGRLNCWLVLAWSALVRLKLVGRLDEAVTRMRLWVGALGEHRTIRHVDGVRANGSSAPCPGDGRSVEDARTG